jgi:nucleoside phosphorylase
MGESKEEQRVLIITALSLEAREVQSCLSSWSHLLLAPDSQYEIGQFRGTRGNCEVILKESGQLNKTCSAVTARAIVETRPGLAMLIGVAGSLRDAIPGDVVVPELIYDYESGKVAEHFLPRPRPHRPDAHLLDLARSIARSERWLQRLPSIPLPRPACYTKPLVAGDILLTSKDSDLYHFIRTYYSDAVAVAMEDAGFMEAAYRTQTPAIVVRGISDQLDDKQERDAQGYQQLAIAHARAFAFELLDQWLPPRDQPVPETPIASLEPPSAAPPSNAAPLLIFLQQLPTYKELLGEALNMLLISHVIYKDQCRHYCQQLQRLATQLQQVLMNPPADRALRLRLDNLAQAVRELWQAVEHLRHCCPPGESRQEQRTYQEAHQQTRRALQKALECLERLAESRDKRPL